MLAAAAVGAAAGLLLPPTALAAQDEPEASDLDRLQVTATRFAEPVQEVPNAISVITGDELRARGATDLRSALAWLGGVYVAPGGDAGPAAAVPGLLGLREADDFLLVVDGVPAGGAFVPHFETVDLHDVERIEVLRGTAPVYFGTTAFAGTINIIHYRAGAAAGTASVGYGSFGSLSFDLSKVLTEGPLRQSLAVDGARERTDDPRARYRRGHALYRAAADIGVGEATLDVDFVGQFQKPASPTPVDDSGQLTDALPADFNQNPADARIDTRRLRVASALETAIGDGHWSTTLAWTRSSIADLQGFLQDGLATVVGDNAAGFLQDRRLDDVYFDTHVTQSWGRGLMVTYGLNELYGRAVQDSATFTYTVPLDGSGAPNGNGQPIDGRMHLTDQRTFFGAYLQARWTPIADLALLAGLRANHTHEQQSAGDGTDSLTQAQSTSRLSGSAGISWRAWKDPQADLDDVNLYLSTGNTFQPPQIDFGPDAGFASLLKPETERSFEAGVKADGFDGRFDVDLSGFLVDFDHQAVTTQVNGLPTLENGGAERYRGVEIEAGWRPDPALRIAASLSRDDARYRDFSTLIGTSMVQLAGNRIPLSPKALASLGLTYGEARGWRASLTANYAGERFLDQQNLAHVGGYATFDASAGYAWPTLSIMLSGSNLGDRRTPVLASELGDGQIYRLPGRRIRLALQWSMGPR